MELDEAIKGRRSIRDFKDKSVPRRKLEEMVDAAQWAPSSCNRQLWKFIIVDNKDLIGRIFTKAKPVGFIKNAPVLIIVLYHAEYSFKKSANIQSAAAAIQNLLLKAYSIGLGSVWIAGMGDTETTKKILGIPEQYEVVAYIAVGYPNEKPTPPQRKEIQKVLSYNEFNFWTEDLTPSSYNPKDWTLAQIARYRGDAIWATSPTEDVFPFGLKKEFEKEIKYAAMWSSKKGNTLEFLPFAGTHTLNLLKIKSFEDLHLFEMSQGTIKFIKDRKEKMGIRHPITYIFDDELELPLEHNEYDQIFCFQKLEHLPKPYDALEDLCEITKPGGNLILSFRNKNSWYYPYYMYKYRWSKNENGVWNYGPFRPLSYSRIKEKIKGQGFSINEECGISPIPLKWGYSSEMLSRIGKITMFHLTNTHDS